MSRRKRVHLYECCPLHCSHSPLPPGAKHYDPCLECAREGRAK